MRREDYMMEHMSHLPLRVGRLQTLAQIPVIAGDSMGVDSQIVARLSPLRRQMVVDPNVDLFAFFVPSRHVYGDDWIDWIEQGVDETTDLQTIQVREGGFDVDCIASPASTGEVLPAETFQGYARIWNWFFRFPSDNVENSALEKWNGQLPSTWYPGQGFPVDDAAEAEFGRACCWPRTIWNTGVLDDLEFADYAAPIVSGALDVRTLEETRARYGSEAARNFFANTDRYRDFMRQIYGEMSGKKISHDAEKEENRKPYLLMHSEQFLTGHDVDATGDESLGRYSGKGATGFKFGFPKRFFPEHGRVWIMALVRYPLMCYNEGHYLLRKANPSYLEASGDPRITAAQPPQDSSDIIEEMFSEKGSGIIRDGEMIPFGNYFRTMPVAYVHPRFEALQGYPFVRACGGGGSGTPIICGTFANKHYVFPEFYDAIFQTPEQLGHAQFYSKHMINVKRVVSPATDSIFAGAK